MVNCTYDIPNLPPEAKVETPKILRLLNQASRALGELKGEAKTLPNQEILINTLFLQEALASSEIENIITTQDELFQTELFPESATYSPEAKEVTHYRDAIMHGYKSVKDSKNII